MKDIHIVINDSLTAKINKIHSSRRGRCKRKQSKSDTIRMLLYIGINQYNSESGSKKVRDAERQQERETREEEIKETREEKDQQEHNFNIMKII